jgi:hypothetical protein
MLKAQTDIGIKGGINITFFNINEGGFGPNSDTEIGYYGGVFLDFKVDNGFHFQPELLYIGIQEYKFLNAPLYLKYDVDYNFHILIGPSLNYFFDFFTNKFKVRADLSLAYDFTPKLNVHLKYTIGFEELAPNVLFLGLGYKL